MTSLDALFQPFKLKGLTLPNRIVMAPMTRSASPGQTPTREVAQYYRRRVEGGVGLILTEGTSPEHRSASGDANVPAFFGAAALAGWAAVLAEVKAAGGFIMPQLWHEGSVRAPGSGPYPEAPSLSPSGVGSLDAAPGKPVTLREMADVIAGFVKSAGYARQLGFDGIELHGAHGYFIDQFLWEPTNRRTDAYGGSAAARAEFAAELVRAVRATVGVDFPIILRFSQWKLQDYSAKLARTPDELDDLLGPLVDAGVDAFHGSTRRFWLPEFPDTDSDLNLAGWTRKLTGKPTITVGSVGLDGDELLKSYRARGAEVSAGRLGDLIRRLERGDFDLVAVGRALLANPDWPQKVSSGRFDELKPYTPDSLGQLQ